MAICDLLIVHFNRKLDSCLLAEADGDILVGTRTEADDELGMVSEDDITESTVRKMCTLLEKRILANQEARTKFPDQPTKFMDSEVELQEALESMQVVYDFNRVILYFYT